MADCCCRCEREGDGDSCPVCGARGNPVSTLTLKQMVQPGFLDTVNKAGFLFCRTANCDVVYFHPEGERLEKKDLRVRVGLKEREEPSGLGRRPVSLEGRRPHPPRHRRQPGKRWGVEPGKVELNTQFMKTSNH